MGGKTANIKVHTNIHISGYYTLQSFFISPRGELQHKAQSSWELGQTIFFNTTIAVVWILNAEMHCLFRKYIDGEESYDRIREEDNKGMEKEK